LSQRRSNAGLFVLAAAAFSYVTAENLPIGLLPQMSKGLGVSGGDVGLLVTVYAAVAGVTAIPFTALSNRLPRRGLLVGAVVLLTVSQLTISVAPTYAVVMGARMVCALAHGVLWSVMAPVAAKLAAPGREGRATALAFGGGSMAFVLGTPIATAVGQAFGWREANAALAGSSALVAIALFVVLPELPGYADSGSARERMAAVPSVMSNRSLQCVCAVTAVAVIGHFSAYTYISEIVRRDGDITGIGLSLLLFGFGGAGIGGTALVGSLTDARPRLAIATGLVGTVVSLAILASLGPGSALWTSIAVIIWGAAFTSAPICLQHAVLRAVPEAPDTGSAMNVVAFQIGIGGGSLAGSLIVSAHHVAVLPWDDLGLTMIAVVIAMTARATFPSRGHLAYRPRALRRALCPGQQQSESCSGEGGGRRNDIIDATPEMLHHDAADGSSCCGTGKERAR